MQALGIRRAIRAGRDWVAERRRQRAVPTLDEALANWIAKEAPGWKGGVQGHTARMTPRPFQRHLWALVGARVNAITEPMILAALLPVWRERRETGVRLFDRPRGTLRLARAQGHAGGIDWEMIREGLPSRRPPKVHRPAMAVADVPGFAAWLTAKETAAARALPYLILTAVRSGEARGAAWAEIDEAEALWTIPGTRMKAGRAFEVPLSPAALALLARAKDAREALHPLSPLCFPGPTTGRALSDVALSKLPREGGHAEATVHGFRYSFR
ncbi:MAG: hypothetical protein NZM40_10760, partial [Sphingomonadaceae bacterium]|nr:hypothetical protein [Sphingomonadaceae bacterium]